MTNELTITKTTEHVWRVVNFGDDAHMGPITAWNVVDRDGCVLVGGAVQGNNTKSGYANIPRKKDAQAFILGYQSAEGDRNPFGVMDDRRGFWTLGRRTALRVD